MDKLFVRDRISELRTKKRVSKYKMSLDLGHSKSYIQSISSGKALPSFPNFFVFAIISVSYPENSSMQTSKSRSWFAN